MFEYNQSTLQAFYFVQSANIYGEPLETDQDWVGIFKNGSLDISPAFSFCLYYDGSVLTN